MAIAKKIAEQIVDAALPTAPITSALAASEQRLIALTANSVNMRWPVPLEAKAAVNYAAGILSKYPTVPARAEVTTRNVFYVYDGTTHLRTVRMPEALPAKDSYLRLDVGAYGSDKKLLLQIRAHQELGRQRDEVVATMVGFIRGHKNLKALADSAPELVKFFPETERPCTAVAIIPTDAFNMLIAK